MSKIEDELKASKILIDEYKSQLKYANAEAAYYKALYELEREKKSFSLTGWIFRWITK